MQQRLKVNKFKVDHAVIEAAVRVLEQGKLIVIPTETVYGLACDAKVPGALDAVYDAKGRKEDKPIARFASSWDVISNEVKASCSAKRLAEAFWPGPLTLVLDTEAGPTGYRVPDHPTARAIVEHVGHSLAVTSANRSGMAAAVTVEEAEEQLGDRVSLYLDGGPCAGGEPSTVVDCSKGDVVILREGAIVPSRIYGVLA